MIKIIMASFAGNLPLLLSLFLVEKAEGKVKLRFNFSSKFYLACSISLTKAAFFLV